jgi:N-methylhydantoinase B/oxoprolinase/acetone carboxylase alpha subunit
VETPESTRRLDVRAAVLTSRFDGIVRGMANTLLRTARSGIINTAHDFSCCVLTTTPELLAMAQSLPIHVMSGPDMTAAAMVQHHPELRPGDAFLHNSPYEGNSHPADHAILVPVLDDAGRHRFTVYAKGHQADCGNAAPTTYMAAARDVYEEGALIFPMVRVQRDYRDVEDVIRMCRARIRVPEQWWGDHLALVGAARIGERKLRELAAEFGWDELDAYAERWFAYSESLMEGAIRALPSGEVIAETRHDPFPNLPEGVELRVGVRVDTEEAAIQVDLRDNPDCLPCGLNLTEATARTAAMIGVFNALPESVPHNGGSFRRIRVHLRENCCVGIPRHPASCSVATTGLANRVGSAVQRALAELGDGLGMAETGLILGPALGVVSGTDPRDGQPFVNQLMVGHAGGAASPRFDGWQTIGDHGAGGVVLLDSVEMDELQYPLLVRERRILTDAEGAGRRRGAPGMLVEYGPLAGDLVVLYASDGSTFPAQGARGGEAGCIARQERVGGDGSVHALPVYSEVTVAAGETIRSITSGGGGYGDPHLREPKAVADDVREGWLSAAKARRVYGVAVTSDGEADEHETAALRAR